MCQGRTEDVSVDVPETSTERPADVPAPQSRGRPVPGLGTSCGRTVDVSGTSTSQGCPRDVSQGHNCTCTYLSIIACAKQLS